MILHSSFLSFSKQNICTKIEQYSGPENHPKYPECWACSMHSGMTIWLVEMPEEYHIIEREKERGKKWLESEYRGGVITPICCYPFVLAQPKKHFKPSHLESRLLVVMGP